MFVLILKNSHLNITVFDLVYTRGLLIVFKIEK